MFGREAESVSDNDAMKRLLFVSTLALALVFVFCDRILSPTPPHAARLADTAVVAPAGPSPAPAVAAASHSAKPLLPLASQPVTDRRRQILDARDMMATIDAIRRNGTSDEKESAALLLAECAAYDKPFEAQQEALRAYRDPAHPLPEESDELVARKRSAWDTLRTRCKGVNALSKQERVGSLRELRADARANPGVVGEFEAISSRASDGDTRWTPAQADSITDALYSGDAVVARAAFWALYSSVDRNAPGGEDRSTALLFGMAPRYVNPRLSEFETLGACATTGRCGQAPDRNDDGSAYSPAVRRLMDEYRAAFAAHRDARAILGIR